MDFYSYDDLADMANQSEVDFVDDTEKGMESTSITDTFATSSYFTTTGTFPATFADYSDSTTFPHDWAVTALLLTVFSIGIIGNFLIIMVIVVLGEYKKVKTHWYVLQLAIADTVFLLTIPFRVVEDIHEGWQLPLWMCKARETMFFLNYYASISFLVLMSFDRYVAICRGFSVRLNKFRKASVTYAVTFLVWLFSLLICLPVMMSSSNIGFSPNCKCEFYAAATTQQICEKTPGADGVPKNCMDLKTKCWNLENIPGYHSNKSLVNSKCSYDEKAYDFIAFSYFNFLVMFILPFTIMTVCYALIARQLKTTQIKITYSEANKASSTESPQVKTRRSRSIASIKDNKNRNRVTSMCICLVALFLCCWLPFHAVHLAKLNGINSDVNYCDHLYRISFIIAYFSVSSHSMLNPCIYNFIGQRSENRLRSAAKSVRMSLRNTSSTKSSSVACDNSSASKM